MITVCDWNVADESEAQSIATCNYSENN